MRKSTIQPPTALHPFGDERTANRMNQHQAIQPANGKVLITGGTSNGLGTGALTSAEVYNPATNSSSTAAPMNVSRYAFTATLLGDGRVLVVGGTGSVGDLSSAEIYDPVDDSWSTTPTMNSVRSHHTATLLPSGHVLVTGGLSTTASLTNTEIYKPENNSWIPARP